MHLNYDSYHIESDLFCDTNWVLLHIDVVANGGLLFQRVLIDFLCDLRHRLPRHFVRRIALPQQIDHVHLGHLRLKFCKPALVHFYGGWWTNIQIDNRLQKPGWSADPLVTLKVVIERALKHVHCVVIGARYIIRSRVHIASPSFIACWRWRRLGRFDDHSLLGRNAEISSRCHWALLWVTLLLMWHKYNSCLTLLRRLAAGTGRKRAHAAPPTTLRTVRQHRKQIASFGGLHLELFQSGWFSHLGEG